MIAGSVGSGSYNGEYLRGDGGSVEIDISTFTDPTTKNAADLVTYAINAYENGWGYVWGTYGNVLTDSLFAYKLERYPLRPRQPWQAVPAMIPSAYHDTPVRSSERSSEG